MSPEEIEHNHIKSSYAQDDDLEADLRRAYGYGDEEAREPTSYRVLIFLCACSASVTVTAFAHWMGWL